ncbi:DNA adenine methylase [Sorangium sp. So ce302]|uniref:DNA adenine methylase n=1 Tax=Sorangium sp. So ce302 TaxID=3133297 RepID=UPI003F5EBF52
MRYFGSKGSTVERLYELIAREIPSGSFCDPFGGIGVIGSFFKSKGYAVWTGDILRFAHYFQIARVQLEHRPRFNTLRKKLRLDRVADVVATLNRAPSSDGWFAYEYAVRRQFFHPQNARRIDGCRRLIRAWRRRGWITSAEHAVLVASLIDSMDRVANTAGTYYAYLKEWHRKAKSPFEFSLIPPTSGHAKCKSSLEDARILVRKSHFDVLYLDPPYNQRSHAHYYHLPETIAADASPAIHGSSGIPNKLPSPSDFNKPGVAFDALRDTLDGAKFKLLVMHYADDGIIHPLDLMSLLREYGRVQRRTLISKGYTTKCGARETPHAVYLVHHG